MSYGTNHQTGCIVPVYKSGCGSRKISSGFLLLALCIPILASAVENRTTSSVVYEIAINNGRVIDPETGLDAQRNIGIRNGKIGTITGEEITAQRTIDARAMIVAPGFIDTHVHALDLPLNQRMLARDGVTTALDLENGAYPFSRWYARLEGNSYINFGASVSSIAVRAAITFPYVVIASDALVYQEKGTGQLVEHFDANLDELNGHPRTTGSHAKVLRLTREENLMSWPEVLAKLSLYQAQFLQENGVPQMRFKGRIQQGMDADITVFDPETVRDNATLDNPARPSTGIHYVLVNGRVVVENGVVLKTATAGTGIRHR